MRWGTGQGLSCCHPLLFPTGFIAQLPRVLYEKGHLTHSLIYTCHTLVSVSVHPGPISGPLDFLGKCHSLGPPGADLEMELSMCEAYWGLLWR